MIAGLTPNVVVRAGGDVTVLGWDSDRVQADTDSRWGLKVERRSETEIGRARAQVGDRVLFDVSIDPAASVRKEPPGEATSIQMGGSGTVQVPRGSTVKVYAGKGAEVRDVQGAVTLYAGLDIKTRNVHRLTHASAGRTMDLECDVIEGAEVDFKAGRDMRCFIHNLNDARLIIHDMGGRWETVFGAGSTRIRIQAGGDVTLVTDQEVTGQPPDYIVGNVEKPPSEGGSRP
jgi:hypothetical protein